MSVLQYMGKDMNGELTLKEPKNDQLSLVSWYKHPGSIRDT